MPKYVEYHYPLRSLFSKTETIICSVDAFDVKTVTIPDDKIVSFRFLEAKTEKAAQKIKFPSSTIYYLTQAPYVLTTQEIRQRRRAFEAQAQIGLEFLGEKPSENDIAAVLMHDPYAGKSTEEINEEANKILGEETSEEREQKTMSDIHADFLESQGCHRIIGSWPGNYIGIADKDVILDRDTHEIISPALKPL